MIKIVIFNQKGGTGKTVSTVNISGCLEKNYKKKVLVIDCDSQMNSTNYLLTYRNGDYKKDIESCIKGKSSIGEAYLQTSVLMRKETPTNIYVLPGSRNVDMLNIKNVLFFQEMLKKEEEKFDYCLFDCPPHISNLTIAALSCADYVLVPALADTDSLCGYDLLLDTVNQIRDSGVNIKLKILGIFFNNIESTKALDNFILNDCKENMGTDVFQSFIRRSSAISQARFYGKPIHYYKPTSFVANDYDHLVREMFQKIEEER